MAELRTYEPTWRDQLARMLLGDEPPSPEWRNTVEGLTGSSGFGQTGMGVIDVTPFGLPLAKQEAQQAAESGNWGDALLAAAAFIPGAKGALAGGKAIAENALEAAPKSIIAYHGSPHDFDRFDLSKIGTGEGAQAYGHGLYFAENEGVARSYRDAIKLDNQFKSKGEAGAYGILQGANFDFDRALDNARGFPALENILQEWKSAGLPAHLRGHMYQVRINADPEQFLEWHKPLREQSESVRSAFSKAALPGANETDDIMRELYGVDAGAEIIGLFPRSSGAQAYNTFIADVGDVNTAVKKLRQAGIPGIKYLDAGSRGAGDGSRNYVVFDDSIIEILRKYGLAGLTAGGALAAGGADEAQAEPNFNALAERSRLAYADPTSEAFDLKSLRGPIGPSVPAETIDAQAYSDFMGGNVPTIEELLEKLKQEYEERMRRRGR